MKPAHPARRTVCAALGIACAAALPLAAAGRTALPGAEVMHLFRDEKDGNILVSGYDIKVGTGKMSEALADFDAIMAEPGTGGFGLYHKALALAGDMLLTSPMGLRLTKDALNLNIDAASMEHAFALEDRQQVMLGQAGDFAEAKTAFFEKRRPSYSHD